ncbi:MAG: hypothetical protein ACQERL_10325 [Bacillota bacterium]
MKYIYALIAGIIAALIAAYFSAVVIGVTNIYLMGHNINWLYNEINFYFVNMTYFDLIVVLITIFVMVATFIITLNIQKSK